MKRNTLDANDFPIIQKLRNRKEFKEDVNPTFMPDEWDAVKSALANESGNEPMGLYYFTSVPSFTVVLRVQGTS